jgi:hypothetical protein
MIETHIKENQKFHKLRPHKIIIYVRKIKTYYFFER